MTGANAGSSRLTLVALAALLGLAGCGGGHAKTTTSQAPTGAQSSADSALTARNVAPADFAGFMRAAPTVEHGAAAWIAAEMIPAAQAAKDTAKLNRLGFVAGLAQHLLATANNHEGLLIVEQFGSPAAARAEAAANYAQFKKVPGGGGFTPFTVTGIPGARAYKATGPQFGGYNVIFADGSYYYLIGAGWQAGDRNPPSRALVVTTAQHQYRRVHALPGG
jgi:hypothetical protein